MLFLFTHCDTQKVLKKHTKGQLSSHHLDALPYPVVDWRGVHPTPIPTPRCLRRLDIGAFGSSFPRTPFEFFLSAYGPDLYVRDDERSRVADVKSAGRHQQLLAVLYPRDCGRRQAGRVASQRRRVAIVHHVDSLVVVFYRRWNYPRNANA